MPIKTVEWLPDLPPRLYPGRLKLVDQTRLPNDLVFLELRDSRSVWQAIKSLQVRGAPAIGVAAAMGVVVGVQESGAATVAAIREAVEKTAAYLATSRPTAVNLFWALERMRQTTGREGTDSPEALTERLALEAVRITREDTAMCRAIGEHGAALLSGVDSILTHCNAGSLATSWYGTALAPVYVAREKGHAIRVFADETRPLLQGARLTAWELSEAGIDTTLICDNMAACVMRQGKVGAVLVGADRIAANGDTANKIGTYGVALLAAAHRIPFYVLAPSSTFDLSLKSGDQIPIEERDPAEITNGFGRQTAPAGIHVYNPAFDVTPASLITAIVCEKGVARPDYRISLAEMG
ncbi:MAG: S-methyl-5-thioribose-1-phosphate isomerase [Kiritimatiellia bacterium]